MTDLEKYEMIDKFLDEHIRPALAGDGGGVELELVKGHEVIVSYQGACGTCPSSSGATINIPTPIAAFANFLRGPTAPE